MRRWRKARSTRWSAATSGGSAWPRCATLPVLPATSAGMRCSPMPIPATPWSRSIEPGHPRDPLENDRMKRAYQHRRATPWLLACACLLALPATAATKQAGDVQAEAGMAKARSELARARAELADAARRAAALSRTKAGHDMAAAAQPADGAARVRLGVPVGVAPQAGVRIVGAPPASGASDAGLRGGDRVLRAGGAAIAGAAGEARVEAAREALSRAESGSKVKLAYPRDGREQT